MKNPNEVPTKALQITTEGEIKVLDLDVSDQLSILQEGVGGFVQAIDLNDKLTLWCNEEGKIYGLPHNPFAQDIWDWTFGIDTDCMVGDIVLTGGTDKFGNTLGLTDQQITDILYPVCFRLATGIACLFHPIFDNS